MNKLYIITGPAGVGKSTISYEIGKKLEKSVVIEGDTIYNFFVGGRIRPWYLEAPLDLFWNNSIMLMKSYLENRYECGILIDSKYRGKGYSKKSLKLLCNKAKENGIKELYDNFEIDRGNTLKLFESVGFKVVKETSWKKFNKFVNGEEA